MSGSVEIHDNIFVRCKTTYVFRSGASLSTRGWVCLVLSTRFLCRVEQLNLGYFSRREETRNLMNVGYAWLLGMEIEEQLIWKFKSCNHEKLMVILYLSHLWNFGHSSPLIYFNLFHIISSISESSVDEPSFNIWFAFHCRAINFTNFSQKLQIVTQIVNTDKIAYKLGI
jgi:hypothetical protein